VANKCSKIGFFVCLLVLLILVCTWLHMGDIQTRKPTSAPAVTATTVSHNVNPSQTDRDHDGINDRLEKEHGLNPTLSDTDGDGKKDGAEGLESDRDHDGIIDALESALDDMDLDGVPDEFDAQNTDPDNDSDGDRYGNALEKAEGTDPLDAKSMPADRDKDGIPDNIDAKGEPIHFAVNKQGSHVVLKGTFGNVLQIHALQNALGQEGIEVENGVMMQKPSLEEGEGITVAQKLLPKFLSLYRNGTLLYADGAFEISGDVATAADKKEMDAFLAENAGLVHYTNFTRVRAPQPPQDSSSAAPKPSTDPRIEKNTTENKAKNRRVEFKIIGE